MTFTQVPAVSTLTGDGPNSGRYPSRVKPSGELAASALSLLITLAGLWVLAALPVSGLLAGVLVCLPALSATALLVSLVAAALRSLALVLAALIALALVALATLLVRLAAFVALVVCHSRNLLRLSADELHGPEYKLQIEVRHP